MSSAPVPLFRKQVMTARRSQWLGPVLLVSPLSHLFYAGLALLVVLAVVTFVTLGDFTRKARINGWLVPSEGMSRVFAQQPGVVVSVNVSEGSKVEAGTTLVVLSSERRSTVLGPAQAEITRLLEARRAALRTEMTQQESLFAQQSLAIGRRIEAIRKEIEQFKQEISLQTMRVDLTRNATQRLREVARVGGASLLEIERQQEVELEQIGRLRQLERTRNERERELVGLRAEFDDLPFKSKALISNLQRDVRTLEQDMVESEARREMVIQAPQAGTVTAVQVEVGSNASTTTPLLSILPQSATLQAHLFANSRAIGFVRKGQSVLLRYQAYPYQKFGHYKGTVESVSRSPLGPAEVPTHLAGLTSLVGANEAIYKIIVRLDEQHVTTYGTQQPLQPGMQLESDILLETRKLWEWMLEPLFTLTGKI